jgi:hypothetical protein
MPVPFIPNALFLEIAKQIPELSTLLSLLLSNRRLSTLLTPVLLRKAAESSTRFRGKTALEHAVSCGDLEPVHSMLSASTLRINARNVNSWTLLDTAIRSRHPDMVQLLLAHGADVAAHGRRYGTTPLALAVLTAQHDVIRMLLAKGADVLALHKIKGVRKSSACFGYEFTVLHYAICKKDLSTVRVLLEGADCGRKGQALIEALVEAWGCEDGERPWGEAAKALRSLITPGAHPLLHDYPSKCLDFDMNLYFDRVENDFFSIKGWA